MYKLYKRPVFLFISNIKHTFIIYVCKFHVFVAQFYNMDNLNKNDYNIK